MKTTASNARGTRRATLVAGGLTRETLESFSARVKPEQVENVLAWTARDVEMRLLVGELLESTKRISELVGAMKSYSYLDQAHEKRPTDLHEGLNNTLTILKHKFKKKSAKVTTDYAELPPVPAYGGELNQVWTNLLDNAVAAISEGGKVTVSTSLDPSGEYACVDIADDGPGVPKDLQGRIFEPFFYHQGGRRGDGAGARHRAEDRRAAARRQHPGQLRTGRDALHGAVAAEPVKAGCPMV